MVGHICRRLDGVPLAIELAAARVNVLAPDDLLARLEDRFRILTSGSRTALPRQQTLRATVDWSHDLLGEAERMLFRRLSVFAGGFDLDACEAICGTDRLGDEPVLDLLAGLVDKSLAVADLGPHVGARYSVLETLREYGREKTRGGRREPTLSATRICAGSSTWPSAHTPAGSTPRASGSPAWSATSTTSGRPSTAPVPSTAMPSSSSLVPCHGCGTSIRSMAPRAVRAWRTRWPGATNGPPSTLGPYRAPR